MSVITLSNGAQSNPREARKNWPNVRYFPVRSESIAGSREVSIYPMGISFIELSRWKNLKISVNIKYSLHVVDRTELTLPAW